MNNLQQFLTNYIDEVVNFNPYNEGNQYAYKSKEFDYELYIKLEDIGGIAKIKYLSSDEEYYYTLKKDENGFWEVDNNYLWRFLDDITFAFNHLVKYGN